MAATFTIATTVATFHGLVQSTRQEAGDLQRLTLGVYMDDPTAWATLQTMLTTKYHVHSTIGGDVVLDIVRGPGVGTLVVDDLGTGTAILVDLGRDRYVVYGQTLGLAGFLLTGGTF